MACDFVERQAATRVVAMGPAQARQEALTLAHLRASLGVAR
jgi:glycerol-3-phosphate dehydrogenase